MLNDRARVTRTQSLFAPGTSKSAAAPGTSQQRTILGGTLGDSVVKGLGVLRRASLATGQQRRESVAV